MLHDASPQVRRISPRWWALAAIAAVLVLPIRPTAQQREAPRDSQSHREHGESWVFLQGDGNTSMHGSSSELEEVRRLRRSSSEPLIWFKRDGRAYVIRNRQLLDTARALFIPQEELGKAQEQLGERQAALGDRQAALGKKQAALGEQQAALSEKMNEAAARVQKAAHSGLLHNEDARAAAEASIREAEVPQRQLSAEQEALGEQQRVLGEQQAALGEEQAVLGRKQEELARAITREMRLLFDRALADGLATPVK